MTALCSSVCSVSAYETEWGGISDKRAEILARTNQQVEDFMGGLLVAVTLYTVYGSKFAMPLQISEASSRFPSKPEVCPRRWPLEFAALECGAF